MAKYEKTVIKFKFLQPIAINLPPVGDIKLGNYYPFAYTSWETVPNIRKPVPKMYYNLDYEYEIELLPEVPRADTISEFEDDPDVIRAYRVDQARIAAANHEMNNMIRDRLKELEYNHIIKVTHDSFLDYKRELKAEKDLKKAAADGNLKQASQATVTPGVPVLPRKRGRKPKA